MATKQIHIAELNVVCGLLPKHNFDEVLQLRPGGVKVNMAVHLGCRSGAGEARFAAHTSALFAEARANAGTTPRHGGRRSAAGSHRSAHPPLRRPSAAAATATHDAPCPTDRPTRTSERVCVHSARVRARSECGSAASCAIATVAAATVAPDHRCSGPSALRDLHDATTVGATAVGEGRSACEMRCGPRSDGRRRATAAVAPQPLSNVR